MWGTPGWGGWGMPFGMVLVPILFLLGTGFLFYFFSRGCFFNGGRGHSNDEVTNRELLAEIQKLRQEIDELKRKEK